MAYGRPQPEPPRRSAFNTAFTATFGVLAALVVLVILGNWIVPMASGGDWYTVHQETTDTITGDSNIIGTATASTTCQWGQWRAHMTVNDQPAQGAPGKSRSSTTRTARACLWTTIARRQARATNSPPAAATASRRLSQ